MGWSLRSARLTLRAKLLAYLALIHVVFAAVAVFVLLENRLALLLVELLFVVSIALGVMLLRALFVPLELIRTGAELIGEQDFSSSFRDVGQPEMDALIAVYNKMIARLREERLRLQEQHTFVEKLLGASPAGILTLDFDGRVSLMNPAARRLLELPEDAAAGVPLAELQTPLGPPLAALEVGSARVLGVQGRRFKCSRAEFHDRGFPRSFFVLEELTEELRSSEKSAYEKLIRMMSHEVNNTVGAVRSLLECFDGYAAQLQSGDRQDFVGALDVATTRLEHLRAFMAGFADMVRLPPPQLGPWDLRQLAEELLLLLGPQLRSRKIVAEWGPSEPLPPISMDRNQIEQVLVNVLKNAMESIGEDGRILLSTGRAEGRPFLEVRDDGPGIAEEDRPFLFTPFFSTKRDGRGLGLTLTREILRQHGFDSSLEPAEPRGAVFRIVFR